MPLLLPSKSLNLPMSKPFIYLRELRTPTPRNRVFGSFCDCNEEFSKNPVSDYPRVSPTLVDRRFFSDISSYFL